MRSALVWLARPRTRRAPLRILASVTAHSIALVAVLGVAGGRVAALPPDPSLVREAAVRAEAALGGRFDVSIREASWTLARGGIALRLGGVRVSPRGDARTGGFGVALDEITAGLGLGGSLRTLHVRGVEAALPAPRPGPIDLAPIETALRTRLAPALAAMDRLGLERVGVTDIRSPRAGGAGKQRRLNRPVVFPLAASLVRGDDGFAVSADLRVREAVLPFAGTLTPGGDLHLASTPVPLSGVWSSGAFATDAPLTATVSAGPGSATALDIALGAAPLHLGRETAPLEGAHARVVIDGGRARLIESAMEVGANRFGVSGSIEAYRDPDGAPAALFALAGADTVLAPADIEVAPLALRTALSGAVNFRTREIELDEIALDEITLEGEGEGADALNARGSATIRLRGLSPAIELDIAAGAMGVSDLPALWPSWIAGGARDWLAANVSAGRFVGGAPLDGEDAPGTVPAARMTLSLAEGRMRTLGVRPLTAGELRVTARVVGGTTALFGDLPPLEAARGTLSYAGTALDVALDGGEARTLGGTVPLGASSFALIDTSDPALPARFDLALSGNATALGALADAAPIAALSKAGFAPDELSGRASGRLTGTIDLRAPERRDWALDLDLDRVALLRALEGRRLGDITGSLGARPDGVRLDATGTLDGVRARFDVVEPIAQPVALRMPDAPIIERVRRVEMTLDDRALRDLAPGLADLIDGPVEVTAEVGGDRVEVTAALMDASVSLPWAGWTKGRGVPATARFILVPRGEGFALEGLDVDGPGFGARGSAVIDKVGLASLSLTRAGLARGDDLRVELRRTGKGFEIDVRGARADARGLLAALDPRGGKSGTGGPSTPISVRARIATVRGHGGVEANGVDVTYRGGTGGMERVALSAALPGGRQLVVDGSMAAARSDLFASTDDMGAALRFLDLYGRVRGGTLTVNVGREGAGPWTGGVAASSVEIRDEPKLRVLASKVARDGRIDGSRVRVTGGQVGVSYSDGRLEFYDGIVRGPEVGAAFAGTLIDPEGAIALTGTFLPAYGLNRIFAEVPVLGAVLGNGRDKGLIGITFRLSGLTRRPKIEVNPLSAMAPGVFRRVFEYR